MKQFKRVGILGGMGPQATLLLQQRVLDSIEASDDASHLPLLVDMNPQVPSRLDWILRQQGEDPAPVLANMAKGLEIAGAQALAMPCNTAHHFADAINKTCAAGDKIGMLASPATIDIKLFENAFAPHQLNTLWPEDLDAVLAAIQNIKANGVTNADISTMQAAASECESNGVSCLVVGCTEFSLLSDALESNIPIIDTLDLLVASIHEFATS